jgi:hypothetical protein
MGPAADFRSASATVTTEHAPRRRSGASECWSARIGASGYLAPVLAKAPSFSTFFGGQYSFCCRSVGRPRSQAALKDGVAIKTARAGVHVTNRMNMTRERRGRGLDAGPVEVPKRAGCGRSISPREDGSPVQRVGGLATVAPRLAHVRPGSAGLVFRPTPP